MPVRVIVTGAAGFIGLHVVEALERSGHQVLPVIRSTDPTLIEQYVDQADAVIHLAGINRPKDPKEFKEGNTDFTGYMCQLLRGRRSQARVLYSSSTQVNLDNQYGQSKLEAERLLEELSIENGNSVQIFRLTNVFGKWSRPNYNSVVATFSHNIAKGIDIHINNPDAVVTLVYIDDVVSGFINALEVPSQGIEFPEIRELYQIKLGELAEKFYQFKESRTSLVLPDFGDPLTRKLYATYSSWLDQSGREYSLQIRSDERGSLAEFLKSPHIGQIFVSRTLPGVTRGNHYHHSKAEKFLVLEGTALIRFRNTVLNTIEEHIVSGEDYHVVDITPGWTHSLTNIGNGVLVTLFWTGEIFDPQRPDTIFQKVDLN